MLGYQSMSEEVKRLRNIKISKALTGRKTKGHSEGTKEVLRRKALLQHKNMSSEMKRKRNQKISERIKECVKTNPNMGHHTLHTEETREKISKNRRGMLAWNKGKTGYYITSPETKQKLRLAAIKYMKEVRTIPYPSMGRNEKRIIDALEEDYQTKFIRQYQVCGYFLDGYSQELNLAIEVDESHHFNNQNKLNIQDIKRQREIEKELNCKFLRIKDSKIKRGGHTGRNIRMG